MDVGINKMLDLADRCSFTISYQLPTSLNNDHSRSYTSADKTNVP